MEKVSNSSFKLELNEAVIEKCVLHLFRSHLAHSTFCLKIWNHFVGQTHNNRGNQEGGKNFFTARSMYLLLSVKLSVTVQVRGTTCQTTTRHLVYPPISEFSFEMSPGCAFLPSPHHPKGPLYRHKLPEAVLQGAAQHQGDGGVLQRPLPAPSPALPGPAPPARQRPGRPLLPEGGGPERRIRPGIRLHVQGLLLRPLPGLPGRCSGGPVEPVIGPYQLARIRGGCC